MVPRTPAPHGRQIRYKAHGRWIQAKVEELCTPLLQEAARAVRAVRDVHGAIPAPVAGSTLLGGLLRLVPGAAGEAGVDAADAVTERLALGLTAGAQRGSGLSQRPLGGVQVQIAAD